MFYIHYYITWYELHWSQEPFFSKNPCKCLKTAILPLKPTIFQEIAILSGFWKKVKKVDPPKIGHFRGGLLSSLLAKNPSKWLYYENFFTLVTSKMHFEPLRGFFGQK